jgi:hypothetical protein
MALLVENIFILLHMLMAMTEDGHDDSLLQRDTDAEHSAAVGHQVSEDVFC